MLQIYNTSAKNVGYARDIIDVSSITRYVFKRSCQIRLSLERALKQKTVWLALLALASVTASAGAADLSAEGTSSESSGASETKDPPKFWVDTGFGGSNYRWLGGFAAITYAPFSGGMDESGPRFRIDSGYGSFYYYTPTH